MVSGEDRGGKVRNRAEQDKKATNLLVCNKDLESRNKVSEGNRLVTLPLLEIGCVVNEDDEVVLLALEVDLGLRSLSSGHVDWSFWFDFALLWNVCGEFGGCSLMLFELVMIWEWRRENKILQSFGEWHLLWLLRSHEGRYVLSALLARLLVLPASPASLYVRFDRVRYTVHYVLLCPHSILNLPNAYVIPMPAHLAHSPHLFGVPASA
jgi:hypothetical protein